MRLGEKMSNDNDGKNIGSIGRKSVGAGIVVLVSELVASCASFFGEYQDPYIGLSAGDNEGNMHQYSLEREAADLFYKVYHGLYRKGIVNSPYEAASLIGGGEYGDKKLQKEEIERVRRENGIVL